VYLYDSGSGGYGPLSELRSHRATASAIARDLRNYLPNDILRKTDTASMSVALEVRAPFLAPELADAAMQARIADLMPRGERKGLLKQVARMHLPDEIVSRPKMGFAIPIGEWFRSNYGGLRTLLLDCLNSKEPFGPPSLCLDLDQTFVRLLLDEHLGQGSFTNARQDHGQRLYLLLVLSIWASNQRRKPHPPPHPTDAAPATAS
jgi:asparagine synthase (glutamine-hydrolysing)